MNKLFVRLRLSTPLGMERFPKLGRIERKRTIRRQLGSKRGRTGQKLALRSRFILGQFPFQGGNFLRQAIEFPFRRRKIDDVIGTSGSGFAKGVGQGLSPLCEQLIHILTGFRFRSSALLGPLAGPLVPFLLQILESTLAFLRILQCFHQTSGGSHRNPKTLLDSV